MDTIIVIIFILFILWALQYLGNIIGFIVGAVILWLIFVWFAKYFTEIVLAVITWFVAESFISSFTPDANLYATGITLLVLLGFQSLQEKNKKKEEQERAERISKDTKKNDYGLSSIT